MELKKHITDEKTEISYTLCGVVSRVMRKFALVSGRNLLQGGRLNRPLVTLQQAGRKGSRAAVRRSSCP